MLKVLKSIVQDMIILLTGCFFDQICYIVETSEAILFGTCYTLPVSIFWKLAFGLDIISGQIDRFLALYLSATYKTIITPRIAKDICLTRLIKFHQNSTPGT